MAGDIDILADKLCVKIMYYIIVVVSLHVYSVMNINKKGIKKGHTAHIKDWKVEGRIIINGVNYHLLRL